MDTIIPVLAASGTAVQLGAPAASSLLGTLFFYRYLLLIPLDILQGPATMILSGVLIRLGTLDFWPAYFVLMAADLIGDIYWYWMGYHFGERFIRKFGRFFSVTDDHVAAVRGLFHRYQDWILIVSKLTTGFGFAVVTLFTAGLSKIPFRRYILLNVIGQVFWTAMLIAVGYFFGHLYIGIKNVFGKVALVAFFVVLLALAFGLAKHLRARFFKDYTP